MRDWLFERQRYGLIDLHDRAWDEPAGNGGFLFNGGRLGTNHSSALGQRTSLPTDKSVPFQISQRADFIVNDCFQWVQHSRSILNLRDEPLADSRSRLMRRIQGKTGPYFIDWSEVAGPNDKRAVLSNPFLW